MDINELFPGLADDLTINLLSNEISTLKKLEKVFDLMNPKDKKRWQEIYLKLTRTDNPDKRNELITKLLENPYFEVIEGPLSHAEIELLRMKLEKASKSNKN